MLFAHCYPKPSVTFSRWFCRIKTLRLKTTITFAGEAWFSGWAHWGHFTICTFNQLCVKIRTQSQILAFSPSQISSWDKRGLHLAEDASEDITRKSKFLEIAALKNWCFWIVQKILESLLDCKMNSVSPKGNQPWIFTGLLLKLNLPIFWPPDWKSWLFGEDPDAGED